MFEILKTNISLGRAFVYDWLRYRKFSFVSHQTSRANRRASIRIITHYIEGGMCFPEVRLGYAQDKVRSLMKKIENYYLDFGADETVAWALATLTDYFEFHHEREFDLQELERELGRLKQNVNLTGYDTTGGSDFVSASEIQAATDFDFSAFMHHRHSVRQYTKSAIDHETIRKIVKNAQQCPSVCNRQSSRVYAITDQKSVQKVLTYQAGNAGFRQEIPSVFIVTANIADMNLIGERYQGWIDGGIFAMSLALAIHAEGLGACFLNWSTEPEQDRALRKCLAIPDNELVITLMSAGHLKNEFRVPVSHRKPVDDILILDAHVS